MREAYTENLDDFGDRERKMAAELLAARSPEAFNGSGVRLAFNRNSGYVFLVNDDYQCAMMNGDELQIFHSTPYKGHEGFLSDLVEEFTPDDMHPEDVDYIRQAAENEDFELPESWKESSEEEGEE